MSLIINGVTIPASGTVKYNNTDLTKIICNGVTVWEKIVFTTKDFNCDGRIEAIELPAGLYKFEVWGAQGGNLGNAPGGYGGYSCRYYYIENTTMVYVGVGSVPSGKIGGYNGGGDCANEINPGGGGGGATHIALSNNKLHIVPRALLIVVAGGGGGARTSYNTDQGGGHGGGLTGTLYSTWNGNLDLVSSVSGKAADQTSGGYINHPETHTKHTECIQGSYGRGANGPAGGGGGLYGGGSGLLYHSPGGGGSGYIGVSSMVHNGITYTNTSTAGVNSGNGKAKITYIAA